MSLSIRRSNERGFADHGWLQSRHTFSFAEYFDPRHMGFRSLLVINEDWIAPGGGFPTHPHRDMEIFTVLVSGELEHRDSMGNHARIRPGDIQVMSAGKGVTHSEFNPDSEKAAHLLQIWIKPHTMGLNPGYTEWRPSAEHPDGRKSLIISPTGRDGSASIHQDADVYRIHLQAGESTRHLVRENRGAWLQIISGNAECGAVSLSAGDALCTEESAEIEIKAHERMEALLFDLA